jgi:serine/threonine protein kinase
MSGNRWQRLQELFDAASALAPGERPAYLDRCCSDDAALREELESLLRADGGDSAFLLDPVGGVAAAIVDAPLLQSRIGAYQVTGELGRGGMGAVYRAVRADDAFRKEVAIKVIRGGADDAQARRRFRAERQILATLDHPHIARLLDGGATEDGRPYVVMELVEGEPLDRYCDARALSLERRLRLFLDVAAAVASAHRRLVVHRDLKPGNILVTAEGTPKLLDFGIAKLLDGPPGAATATLMRAMTPAYASPEQVRGGPITTATDVYALGMILYELLTGEPPYRVGPATGPSIDRIVCEQQPESVQREAPLEVRRQGRSRHVGRVAILQPSHLRSEVRGGEEGGLLRTQQAGVLRQVDGRPQGPELGGGL